MKRNSGTQSLFLKKVKNIMLIAKEYNDVNENNSFQKGNFSNVSKLQGWIRKPQEVLLKERY